MTRRLLLPEPVSLSALNDEERCFTDVGKSKDLVACRVETQRARHLHDNVGARVPGHKAPRVLTRLGYEQMPLNRLCAS
jgi:hypothetical protein